MSAESARYSFRHPLTGEWAHNLAHSLQEESWQTYLLPAWEYLRNHPSPVLRVVEVGFGRGFNIAELLRRFELEFPGKTLEVTAFEPFPENLEPWPEVPAELAPWLPWWEKSTGTYQAADARWKVQIHAEPAQRADLWPEGELHLISLDLFSPGRHPEQWLEPLIGTLSAKAAPGGQLCSYTCARSVRERLAAEGWQCLVRKEANRRDCLHAVFQPENSTGHVRIPT